jgi:hypothetical protein
MAMPPGGKGTARKIILGVRGPSVEVEPDGGDVFEDGEVPASVWDFFAVVDADDGIEIDAADLDPEGDDVFDVAECAWADRVACSSAGRMPS